MAGARRSMQSGVSLVEVLMTLFIMALATSLVVMTIPERDRGVDREAERLVRVLDKSQRLAKVSGQTIGIRAGPDRFAIVRRNNETWQSVPDGEFVLEAGVRLNLNEIPSPDGDRPNDWPQVSFDPLGHDSVARILVEEGRERRIVVLGPGGVSLEEQ